MRSIFGTVSGIVASLIVGNPTEEESTKEAPAALPTRVVAAAEVTKSEVGELKAEVSSLRKEIAELKAMLTPDEEKRKK